MNTGAGQQVPHAASSPVALNGVAAAEAAAKKGPPPPPPKKSGIVASLGDESSRVAARLPPVPMASKPRPT
nr:hypothetical protein CFP56_79579 [Quercus suber]